MKLLRSFAADDRGQDLTEYVLLLAFVCLASSAVFIGFGFGPSLQGIWTSANTILVNANTAATGAS